MKNLVSPFIRIIFLFLFLVSVIGIAAQTSNPPALTPKQVAQRTLPSIVILIINNGDSLPVTTGSGFFVDEDTIVTNYHVVKNARLGAFKIYGSDEVYSVIGTVGIDSVNDLALLKVKGVKGKPLKLNGAYQMSIGDEVFTASSPKGLEGSFSQGLISGLRKTSKEDLIQITAPISHGSSGGAILNNQAEVIAVAVGGIDEGQSLNFAVPIKYAQTLMAKRTALAELPSKINNSYGNASTSSLGVGSGSRQNANPISSNGSSLGSSVESPSATNESVIKTPSSISGILKSRILPPNLKPGQFKTPDVIDEMLGDDLHGDVFGTLISSYKVIPNYKNFKKGEMSDQTVIFYNRDGNTTDWKFNYSGSDNEYSYTLTYDPRNRTVTEKSFKNQTSDGKEITVYDSEGEISLINKFAADGKMESKTTIEKTNQFLKTKKCYADNSCDTFFKGLDKNGYEVKIDYIDKNLSEMSRVAKKDGLNTQAIYYDFCHEKGGYDENYRRLCDYNGKPAKITTIINSYDPQTQEIVARNSQTQYLDKPNKPEEITSSKYEYKYDSKGNWIEKIEKKEVTKFGETYFEPISFTERKIRYYSDPDTKPSVNKNQLLSEKRIRKFV